ncbi:hypothetical protein JCGZ_01052 [Jatropha curcas]|uniref:Uncharacterized protein n=1 Tax=Jatropha curcas TaxID=180498 RepID=A0A067L478_JATCU|nr:hypothetical protein JCGZ_01052 [Jatropha curcas]
MAATIEDAIPQSKLPYDHQHNVDIAGVALGDKEEEVNDNPIEQVRLTVPIRDDPTEPALTFRTWVLGIMSCVLLAFVNQFFSYRSNPLGPFTLKEHVLITIFASCGASGVYAVNILTAVKAFYRRPIHPVAAMLLLLGYGWAGIFRKILVDSPYMWWPSNLVQVSLFRALNDKEKRPKGRLTRLQFFTIVFIASYAYYIIPGYLFPSISTISFICWIWKDSVTAQQIGSGRKGLGIVSFGLDWSTVASFLGTPLAMPLFAIANTLAGFFVVQYIIVPSLYWSNTYDAKKFPIFSSRTFDNAGQIYNITRILNQKNFDVNLDAYNNYSKLYLSVLFAINYGLSFASLTATISHVLLFEGKTIWNMWRKTAGALKDQFTDVHTRLMKKNYEEVPQWWFVTILVISVALSLLAVEGFNKQLQLPWWGLLLACGIALFFTLPIGVVQATTNMQMGLNVITELIIGYIYPGKPLANVTFKTYGYISMSQALTFVQDFKLGHYMKIPPKSMFLVQLVGTIVGSTVYFATAWWLLSTVENICLPDLLPDGSPWTCPGDDVFYNASIIWGVIGPLRMFGKLGVYSQLNWFFLIGAVAPIPVWLLTRKFPEKKWIKLIHMPIFLSATISMPPAGPVHYWSWGAVGLFFNFYVYRKYKRWWARHNYILSAGLDAGIAFMGIVIFFALQSQNIYGPQWWGLDGTDHCPLAKCPTAPGIVAKGCPVVQ